MIKSKYAIDGIAITLGVKNPCHIGCAKTKSRMIDCLVGSITIRPMKLAVVPLQHSLFDAAIRR